MANSQDIGIIDQPNGGNLNNGGHLNKHVDDENKQTDNQVFSDHETVSNFKLKCGWLNFRPEFLQRFLSAKWALFWLCWAAAMQGKFDSFYIELIMKILSHIIIHYIRT